MIEHTNLDETSDEIFSHLYPHSFDYLRRLRLFMGNFYYAPFSDSCPRDQYVDFLMYYFSSAYHIDINKLISYREIFARSIDEYYDSKHFNFYTSNDHYSDFPWDEFKDYVETQLSYLIENLDYSPKMYYYPYEGGREYCHILPYFATIIVYVYKNKILMSDDPSSQEID